MSKNVKQSYTTTTSGSSKTTQRVQVIKTIQKTMPDVSAIIINYEVDRNKL